MKISSKARYAIQAMFQLALNDGGKPVTLAEITEEQAISSSYIEQLLGQLRAAGLVEGLRGPGGGYRLAKSLGDITISDILLAVDDKARAVQRNDLSQQDERYQFNHMWHELCGQILEYLSQLTLAQFVESEDVQRLLHEQRLLSGRERPAQPLDISKSA